MGEASASASSLLPEASLLPSAIPMEETFPSSLPRQWLDFRRSRPPCKVGMIVDGKRISKPYLANPKIKEAFAAGNPIVDDVLPRRGSRVLLDFLRKICVFFDGEGAATHVIPIYWVDDAGLLFLSTRLGGVDEASVRKAFDGPCRILAVTAVTPCDLHEDRVLGFLDKMKVHKTWVFGWYGAATSDVEAAANGGEHAANWQLLGAQRAHGHGVHVSALDSPVESAVLSLGVMGTKPDSPPSRVLFCALAPGSREVVPAGSPQSQPSSRFFHTATDSISETSWYVFWENSARTSLLPLYTVTFVPSQEYHRLAQKFQLSIHEYERLAQEYQRRLRKRRRC